MKIIVAVALVAFGAVLQNASAQVSLSTKLETIKTQINVVQETLDTVQKLQYVELFPPILDFMAYGQKNMSGVIESHYNETADRIKESAHNYTAAGKDPASCVAATESSSQTLRTKLSRTVDACFDIAQSWLYRIENMLEANIREAMNIVFNINLIFPTCYTTDVEDIDSCIAEILPNATQIVEIYRTTTVTALANISNFQAVQNQMSDCFDAAEIAVEESWHTVEHDFAKCVAAL